MSKETRSFDFDVRADQNDEHGHFIYGRPIVFNAVTNIGPWDEIIADGALDNCDLRDVRLLVNHDVSKIPLARSRNNNANSTMQLSVVPGEGMDIRADVDVDGNADARSLYSAVSRGDISGMSFMFTVDDEEWQNPLSDHPTRIIRSIGRVFECSAVTWPAYEQTSIESRGLSETLESGKEALESVRAEARKKDAETRKQKIRILLEVSNNG